MTPAPLHMGSLHAVELVLFIALALGPFVGLGAVIVVARRRDNLIHPPHEGEPPC